MNACHGLWRKNIYSSCCLSNQPFSVLTYEIPDMVEITVYHVHVRSLVSDSKNVVAPTDRCMTVETTRGRAEELKLK